MSTASDPYWQSVNLKSLLLWPLSLLFCVIAWLRRMAYQNGIFTSFRASIPVIIVGNITVGGSGKTPLIIYLVKYLKKTGMKPAVISRGYGGSVRQATAVCDDSQAEVVGDEPLLIYQQTACPVVVGPVRAEDVSYIQQHYDCNIILSDDGMQHYALQRDAEIAVIDADRGFGNGFCLPAGPLREKPSRLNEVDLVIYNGGESTKPSFRLQASNCTAVGHSSQSVSLLSFSGQTVHALAGIGHPQRFFDMLESQGIKVIPHAFPDHWKYTAGDLKFEDAHAVLMTEKDAVKCQQFKLDNCWSVPVEVQLSDNARQAIDNLIDSLK